MIRTAIIYGILDFCIKVMFDKINGATIPIESESVISIHVGDKYSAMRVMKGGDAIYYFNCEITTVDRNTVFFMHSGHYGVRTPSGELHFYESGDCSIADVRDILALE